ncbi:UDP-N-acetylmuramoyl-tripeptide--D-alanyl-D-alanine ligase [Actimicrobium sp. CCI2.3]|uniref:UDP-N-acetylmuramoyl-tripeptide--D-alanyl-D- alanine ligase n=1 Tax=Actimicrobium sp. CCI2.3 TaxID=3048616 RepID=UPI002AB45B19|nr:UDP-N-acetylmuramoyl-tripeptide--D-alanyl-D-alanine ligase [Actimicrobium sp. CCI2.3]MDY7573539.1 UDP-N-acetylmuramoyl-tripeptide--D-alanyl-D-alanine ligase [Actimicrobium sp. CCI2.3]MEB0022052.1 UDP-N-acetylmuramoyl-tripeptide--D-alanyl-D-alanine ligase [Actimicrobium sp. CCI2.3]
MKSTLSDLQLWLAGARANGDASFEGISTDSRTATAGSLFIALRGEKFDAHKFMGGLAARGVTAAVVERVPKNLDIPALIVPDTRVALGAIARHWRRQFSLPVIGVTGSNGKTTVKEMLAAILGTALGVDHFLATRGNFNNDIGVPLTVLRLQTGCRAAVIELGMNHPGEIAQLSVIAQPTLGLVNNAQREHQEFMVSVEAVAKENGAVLSALPANGIAVFPADDPYTPLWRGLAGAIGQRKVMTFGLSGDADVTCTWKTSGFGSELQVRAGERTFAVTIDAAGQHNVRNALAAITCALGIGIGIDAIVRGLAAFAPVSGRLQRKQAINGAQVIDDSYNANPDSVRAAIDVLAQAPSPRVLVLGDMGEVGNDGRKYHEEVGAYARGRGVQHLLTMGVLAQHSGSAFGAHAKHFKDIETLQQDLDTLATPDSTVLVKGSRFMQMERVVLHLTGQSAQETH